jgi:hypothetical protein
MEFLVMSRHSRFALLVSILVVIVAACGAAAAPGSPQPSQPIVTPSLPPTEAPATPSPAPTDRPSPSPAPIVTPEPTEPAAPQFTADEQYLVNGIHRDATDCVPVRDDLPGEAIAGIECDSDDPAVARIGFFLFESDAAMLDAYFARMDAEGVVRDSGGTDDEEGESAYIPGPEGEVLPDRHGRFVNAEGFANYRATLSGNHVYIGILGRSDDTRALVDFAWRGVQDVPGTPSLWGVPID